MSKNSVWLELAGDRVLVDVGSVAEGYWQGLGYGEPRASLPDEPVVAEKPARKARVKKTVEALES
ncbi:hypothetical protein ACI2KC_09680 [Pseudomonas monteilii]